MKIEDCRIIDLRRIPRREGSITPVDGLTDIPFSIARVYFLYDVPGGANRGGHAHKKLEQLVVAAMGEFDVVIDDGERRKTFTLNRAYHGLYLSNMVWREIVDFSSGGVCLVLASQAYDKEDYIRDYDTFASLSRGSG